MPIRILERDFYPKRCVCGCGGFFVEKETKKTIIWECAECGRKQKFKKGREVVFDEIEGKFIKDDDYVNI
jgi:hypothetical protein